MTIHVHYSGKTYPDGQCFPRLKTSCHIVRDTWQSVSVPRGTSLQWPVLGAQELGSAAQLFLLLSCRGCQCSQPKWDTRKKKE